MHVGLCPHGVMITSLPSRIVAAACVSSSGSEIEPKLKHVLSSSKCCTVAVFRRPTANIGCPRRSRCCIYRTAILHVNQARLFVCGCQCSGRGKHTTWQPNVARPCEHVLSVMCAAMQSLHCRLLSRFPMLSLRETIDFERKLYGSQSFKHTVMICFKLMSVSSRRRRQRYGRCSCDSKPTWQTQVETRTRGSDVTCEPKTHAKTRHHKIFDVVKLRKCFLHSGTFQLPTLFVNDQEL